MAQRTKIQLPGAETIRAHVPLQRKGQPWTMELRPVSYFPDLGETPADAEAFASTIAESLRRMDAAEREHRQLPAAEPMTPCAEGGKRCYFGSDKTGIHVGHGPSAEHWDDADYAALMAQAAAFRPVAVPAARTPRKAAPVYAEAVAAVPDAMTVCNGCELRPMVASEHPGYAAGLCAECYAEATAPEPETPVEPEPVAAPVLTVVPSRSRPTCERCGQTFRVSGTGYAWHVANRPDCASRRLAVVA